MINHHICNFTCMYPTGYRHLPVLRINFLIRDTLWDCDSVKSSSVLFINWIVIPIRTYRRSTQVPPYTPNDTMLWYYIRIVDYTHAYAMLRMRCDAMRIRLRGADIYIQPLYANRSSEVTLIWDHLNQQIKVIVLFTRMFCYHRNGSKRNDSSRCRLSTWTARLARRAPQECGPDTQTAFAAPISNRLRTGCSLVTLLQPTSTTERRREFWKRACLFHSSWAEPYNNSPRTINHNRKFWLTIVFE